ncbi:MAG: outer membrane lipoprotein-sorting protein, partial [Myxococcota bacterium]
DLLAELDERQRSVGDYKALVFIDQKRKGESDLVYEAVVYRRDASDKQVIMFLKPKSEAGKGYLRLERNLFLFDPSVGKWERRTERESIGGTNSQRRDFAASSFSADYAPVYMGQEKLGKFSVHHMKLEVKEGRDVPYPTLELWVDTDSKNLLKVQEFALSGRLMRTSYYPKWAAVEGKGKTVYFPKQIRIFDEVEKDNKTTIVTRKVDLDDLPDSIFTKAWVESKSR